MGNYLAEQERFIDEKLSYRLRKKIAFMVLIINKCLMAIELSPKGRNPNITPQTRTP
jgi:hypothetical protein